MFACFPQTSPERVPSKRHSHLGRVKDRRMWRLVKQLVLDVAFVFLRETRLKDLRLGCNPTSRRSRRCWTGCGRCSGRGPSEWNQLTGCSGVPIPNENLLLACFFFWNPKRPHHNCWGSATLRHAHMGMCQTKLGGGQNGGFPFRKQTPTSGPSMTTPQDGVAGPC